MSERKLLCPRCRSAMVQHTGTVEGGLRIFSCQVCRAQFSETAGILDYDDS